MVCHKGWRCMMCQANKQCPSLHSSGLWSTMAVECLIATQCDYVCVWLQDGRCYLYMKTVERAHTPKNMWQKIKLKRNYVQALEQLDQHLQYWPKFLVHKNKQRLTKITQYLIRMRKLALKPTPKLVPIAARCVRCAPIGYCWLIMHSGWSRFQ